MAVVRGKRGEYTVRSSACYGVGALGFKAVIGKTDELISESLVFLGSLKHFSVEYDVVDERRP